MAVVVSARNSARLGPMLSLRRLGEADGRILVEFTTAGGPDPGPVIKELIPDPLKARLVGLVESLDTMIRPTYRRDAMPIDRVIASLERGAGRVTTDAGIGEASPARPRQG